ncbi:MAG: BON domain-containing protein [Aquitalea sp.]|nr:BON domain-containing protein [Aquitalea sp.]
MKRLFASSILFASLALHIGFTPLLAHAEDAPVSDEQLASNVKNALDADPELKALDLHVSSKKQEVTIDGKMTDDQQMFKAGVIAEKIPGVKFVINNMNM